MQKVIFMCGFPASGKTTFSKNFVEKNPSFVRLGADDIRQELYGSTDIYGDPEEVWHCLMKRMEEILASGKNLIYDAVNMRKDYRLDFMPLLNKYPVEKTLLYLSVDKDICRKRFLARKRNIPIESVEHYFSMNPQISEDEGWDKILIQTND